MDYKISIVYMSYRPGGFDLLADALVHQTYKNYELIVIDDYPNRNLTGYLEDKGIPVTYYGPMKPKVLKDTTYSQANVLNTALLYATGDILVVYNDYSWIPPDSLERWNRYFNEHGLDCIVSGVAREYQGAKPDVIGDVSVWEPPFTGLFNMSMYYSDWIPEEFELFYSAIPIKYLVDINGFDERSDYWCVFLYDSTLSQAKLNGMKVVVDREHCIKMINHRTWSLGDPKWWHVVRVGGPQRNDPPQWLKRSNNGFNLREERSMRRMLK
jgi:glycosyltransferase involved in cell wall biosynthesis